VPTALPGGRAPHCWLEDGSSLFDRLGFEFTLLRLGPKPAAADGLVAAAQALTMPLRVVELAEEAIRDLYGADLVLVRPDQIVAWRGDRPPSDAARLLAVVAGR
jgi:hypothetical protein